MRNLINALLPYSEDYFYAKTMSSLPFMYTEFKNLNMRLLPILGML